MSNSTKRYAVVKGHNITTREVAAYLPGNYRVNGSTSEKVYIVGEDNAGWTLEDYVIPRLASGNLTAVEINYTFDPD